MRLEHSETKAKTRPRPKICYETETKNYETETSPVKSIARESNTNRFVSFFTHMR